MLMKHCEAGEGRRRGREPADTRPLGGRAGRAPAAYRAVTGLQMGRSPPSRADGVGATRSAELIPQLR